MTKWLLNHVKRRHNQLTSCSAINNSLIISRPSVFPKNSGTGPFGMRHHAKHIAVCIADTGNISHGPIRIGRGTDLPIFIAIAKIPGHLLPVRPVFFIGIIPSFTMRHRYFEIPYRNHSLYKHSCKQIAGWLFLNKAPGKRWDSQRSGNHYKPQILYRQHSQNRSHFASSG